MGFWAAAVAGLICGAVIGFALSRTRAACWVGLHGTKVASSASNRLHCSICGKFMARRLR